MDVHVHVGVTLFAHFIMKNEVWNTYFPQWFHVFLLLVAVSSTFQTLRLHQHVFENRDLESVCDTPQPHTHNHTQRRTPTHTTKHTNKTPITHHKHTAHTHTTHIHRTPSKSKHVRTRKMVNCAWWVHIFVESRDDTDVQIVTFRSACFPQGRWSWTIFEQVKRMIEGIGNMLFSTSPELQNGQDPSLRWTAHENSTCGAELSSHCLPSEN